MWSHIGRNTMVIVSLSVLSVVVASHGNGRSFQAKEHLRSHKDDVNIRKPCEETTQMVCLINEAVLQNQGAGLSNATRVCLIYLSACNNWTLWKKKEKLYSTQRTINKGGVWLALFVSQLSLDVSKGCTCIKGAGGTWKVKADPFFFLYQMENRWLDATCGDIPNHPSESR